MSRIVRYTLTAGVFAALSVVPVGLSAQTSTTQSTVVDSLAFPRKFVNWIMSGEADSAFAHSAPGLRESMKSAQELKGLPARLATRFGAPEGTDAEVQFDEGALKVYIVVMRYSLAPAPSAWVVAYNPATSIVERSSFTTAANAKKNYPQAKLP